jgi:uncharacterized protein YydD (DUF2326 family)
VFSDAEIYFPDQLRHDYEQLVEFNRQITEERSKYLKSNLAAKQERLSEIRKRLAQLDRSRTEKLTWLKETDSIRKYKQYQTRLIDLQSQIDQLRNKLDLISKIRGLESHLAKQRNRAEELRASVQESIDRGSPIYNAIKGHFLRLTQTVLGCPGLLHVVPNNEGSPEFHADITGNIDDGTTAEGEGYTYRKMECVFFDLALLMAYQEKSFYRFVFHDAVLDTLDDRRAIAFIEECHRICDEYGLQYITTVMEDKIPYRPDGTRYEFTQHEVILQLDDRPDGSGTLFGFRY